MLFRRRASWVALGVASLVLTNCSGTQVPVHHGPYAAREYFPLAAGAAWSFDTETGFGVGTVLATLTVVNAAPPNFQVRSGTHTESYELRPDGVLREGEYILRDPIRVGATWTGRDEGQYAIHAVGGHRQVTAGSFNHVIEVAHTNPVSHLSTTTWYAAGVGVVEIQAESVSSRGTAIRVRSTLRAYALSAQW